MKAGITGAFASGIAVGVLCAAAGVWLGVAWKTGVWTSKHAFDLKDRLADFGRLPPRSVPRPNAAGEADRAAPENPPVHLSMPIAGIDPRRINDTFGSLRTGRTHAALDIQAPQGAPVLAATDGRIARLSGSPTADLTIWQLDGTGSHCYYYAQLSRYATGLREGALVRRGEVLGYVGESGAIPHLHFAVFKLGPDRNWWNGTPIDPLALLH